MKNKISLLLAMVMVLNITSSSAFAINLMKSYNLYDDTHPNESSSAAVPTASLDYSANSKSSESMSSNGSEIPPEKTRNEILRDSSRNVYSNQETTPAWEIGPSYYPEPSLDSIIEKYRKSDFAGCLQECISYVRQNPYDTLGFYYLAMSYTKVNDKDNAIRAYEKVISLNDNPMIVKYATNGRNCIMGNDNEKCYPNVNEPELIYPYANVVNTNLTPVDPQTLIDRNLVKLREKLSPQVVESEENSNVKGKEEKDKVVLPFGQQDDKLDKFINAPYGNGLSPELNKEYKQLQLRKIQGTINNGEDSVEKENRDLKYIKKFDNQKSDLGTDKLAYDNSSSEWEKITKDPEFIKQKQEIDELNMLLGNDKTNNKDNMMDMLPYMSESGNKNLSPEVIQAMMMKSMMSDFTL